MSNNSLALYRTNLGNNGCYLKYLFPMTSPSALKDKESFLSYLDKKGLLKDTKPDHFTFKEGMDRYVSDTKPSQWELYYGGEEVIRVCAKLDEDNDLVQDPDEEYEAPDEDDNDE